MDIRKLTPIALALSLLTACGEEKKVSAQEAPKTTTETIEQTTTQPTAEQAKSFTDDAEATLSELAKISARAAWVASNFITFDTEQIAANADKAYNVKAVELAKEAAKFNGLELDPVTARKLEFLKQASLLPAPSDPALATELSQLSSKLQSMYGAGKYCDDKGECRSLGELTSLMATSRDEPALLDAWQGWRTVSPAMKELYTRQIEIANQGANQLGYDDLSTLWRSGYDMTPEAFAQDLDHQWNQVKPLYDALQCHVRHKLGETYGEEVVGNDGKIPAHLLGNMWAQTWGNVYELVKPESSASSVDITALIEKKGMTQVDMVKTGEQFFSSLGFAPLPESFWQRSLITKPQDRDVVCHASAWSLDGQDDIRIKMCTQRTGEDFQVVHHELGHNYYQRAYKAQPYLFQGSANGGFHEAVGDTVALSITPKYLVEIGMLDKLPEQTNEVDELMRLALDKIAFLPFGLLVDKWRWQVFSGEVQPDQYNQAWWKLREQYQGVKAPIARDANAFDPGAKYHIPGNSQYAIYFLAAIQQFQFHRALCEEAGHEGPLNQCSIYNSKEAGDKLIAMLEMGASKPWQEAMTAITGQDKLDASAIIDYFDPLIQWLNTQNEGRQCGW